RTGRVTRAQDGEQVAHRFLVAQAREGEAAVGDAVDLGQGDQRLGDAAQFLGLRQGGLDQLVLEQRGGHVLEHRFAVGTGTVELATGLHVTPGSIPWLMLGRWTSLSPSWRYIWTAGGPGRPSWTTGIAALFNRRCGYC